MSFPIGTRVRIRPRPKGHVPASTDIGTIYTSVFSDGSQVVHWDRGIAATEAVWDLEAVQDDDGGAS